MFDLNDFISKYVTKRADSLFIRDIEQNRDALSDHIRNSRVLVIGGAGSIGSSFIRDILPFKPDA